MAAPGDQRTRASHRAFEGLFGDLPAGALCLSIGGGPRRIRPELVNLNLAAFPNVDIVADAYELPYADGAVDLVHCEAVLEHLEDPDRAAAEMFRVLRPDCGRAFIATPFLQPYHGYPDHFQNFTLSGHRRLFERAGFRIREAGTCVGPVFALRDLCLNLLRSVLPGGDVGRWLARLAALLTLPLLYLDRIAAERPDSSALASSTYLLLERRGTGAAKSSGEAGPRGEDLPGDRVVNHRPAGERTLPSRQARSQRRRPGPPRPVSWWRRTGISAGRTLRKPTQGSPQHDPVLLPPSRSSPTAMTPFSNWRTRALTVAAGLSRLFDRFGAERLARPLRLAIVDRHGRR